MFKSALMVLPGIIDLYAQVIDATPLLYAWDKGKQGLNEFCFHDTLLCETRFILAHQCNHSSNSGSRRACSEMGYIIS